MPNAVEEFQANRIALNDVAKTEDIKIKTSPFIYRKGEEISVVRKRNCSKIRMHSMVQNGQFTQVHEDILRILQDYTYLNSFLIRKRLSYLYQRPIMAQDSFRKILKSMVDNGLLIQIELYYYKHDIKNGSPFIYALSQGGKNYLKEKRKWHFGITKESEPLDIGRMLCILAENQFLIMTEAQYASTNLLSYMGHNAPVMRNAGIRILYGFRLPSNARWELFGFAIRDTEDCMSSFLSHLESIQQISEDNHFAGFSVLCIIENESQSILLEKERAKHPEFDGIDVIFTTDLSIISNKSVFERLISVSVQGAKAEKIIFSWNLV